MEEKRTKDLTEAEILSFKPDELEKWMHRVMARLYKLLAPPEYDQLVPEFVATCSRSVAHAKRALVGMVQIIKTLWTEPELQVVK